MSLPFHKMSKPAAKAFFAKYVPKFQLPDPSTIWKFDLKPLYDKTIENIRQQLADDYVWISVDETSDRMKRKVVNIIVGNLTNDLCDIKRFLLDMKFVEKCDKYAINMR